ncbi:MAG: hypothetical protein K1X74_15775 [Pirellulales bacterium]|nr:hypothetical protein [Pirellulales bacterium]
MRHLLRWLAIVCVGTLPLLTGCVGGRAGRPQQQLDRFVAAYLIDQATPSAALQSPDGRWYRRLRLIRSPQWCQVLGTTADNVPRARLSFEYDVWHTASRADRGEAERDQEFQVEPPLGGRYGFRRRDLEFAYRDGRWQRLE